MTMSDKELAAAATELLERAAALERGLKHTRPDVGAPTAIDQFLAQTRGAVRSRALMAHLRARRVPMSSVVMCRELRARGYRLSSFGAGAQWTRGKA